MDKYDFDGTITINFFGESCVKFKPDITKLKNKWKKELENLLESKEGEVCEYDVYSDDLELEFEKKKN